MTAQPTSPLISGFPGGPRLLADIGGTNARFALELAPGEIDFINVLACGDYATIADALRAYLALPEVAAVAGGGIRHGAIAIANPVTGDCVRMTNHHWEFSIEALRKECGFDVLVVVNDFTALASSLPFLSDEQKRQVGGGVPQAGAPLGLIGAGTGLGVSGLIPNMRAGKAEGWTALLSEGGHASFSPVDPLEVAILQYAWTEFEHVSAERFMSGVGIELIYRALCHHKGVAREEIAVPEIVRRALDGECALCDEVVEAFCRMLGTVAGNLGVTLGAQGGIYIGGGIVPRLGARFDRSGFRARYEAKGRFSGYLGRIPTYVITAQYPAFVGVSAILSERLLSA
ncbi:glucokinase [Pseudoduganella namucuonensis]|uniref:Glucokinase n=1 Tax=Pseudoduganella namucuonensis TaxID=1035707 RepID=A0A1I7LLW5_9BURK|nr:glucokinase [Pseudoduganella namucuonensis]SFV10671.1 glucokinase [Pseudoduganella namucuonensis]